MATQSLLRYLSIPPRQIPIHATSPAHNTTNDRYGPDDISQVVAWPQFNYDTSIQKYGPALNAKQIIAEPFGSSPPAILDESQFHLRFGERVLPRIRRSLRAAFEQLAPELQQQQLSAVTLDGGSSAAIIDQFKPDTAFFVVGGEYATKGIIEPQAI